MTTGYTDEQWRAARDAVVYDGATYDDAAERSGVGVSSLQKRAAKEGWQTARQQVLTQRTDYRDRVHALKSALLDKALEKLDPQVIHAWRGAEAAHPEYRYQALSGDQKRTITAALLRVMLEYFEARSPELVAPFAAHVEGLGVQMIEAEWVEGAA